MLQPEKDIKAKIDKRADQLDAKAAAKDADWAEQDAADAIDYAVWMVYDAQLAVLDALDARIYADERPRSPAHRSAREGSKPSAEDASRSVSIAY